MMKKLLVLPLLCLFNHINATNPIGTSVDITIVNLPKSMESQSIALVGNLNAWSNATNTATVSNQTLKITIENVTLSALGSEWIDAPAGANAGFRFVKAGTWENKIIAYHQSNDGNFRMKFNENSSNTVIIDAQFQNVPIIDQDKLVTINGIKVDSTPINHIDPTKFAFPGGKWKALVMSYDDSGYQDRDLINIFNSNGIIGSFNINSGSLGNSDKIKASEVATLYSNGNHEVALHTVSHPHLENETDNNLYHQIADCQTTISNLVGYKVTGMAYPFGTYDKRTLKVLTDLGIVYSRTTINTFSMDIPHDVPSNFLRWNPTCHDSGGDYWANQLINWNKQEMALLHIWGHSWEHTGNWTSLNNLCAKLGKRSDVWYAKAWDVATYLTAIANLEPIGIDGYYNPSKTISVWVKTTSGVKELKPLQSIENTLSTGYFENSSLQKLNIYPNPTNDSLSLDYYLFEPSNVEVFIYDSNGRIVKSIEKTKQNIGSQHLTFESNSLSSGIYFLNVMINKSTEIRKIIVQNTQN